MNLLEIFYQLKLKFMLIILSPAKQALFAYNGSVFKTMQTDTIPGPDKKKPILDFKQTAIEIEAVI